MNFTIDPLNATILESYHGAIHGNDSRGIIDIEFDSLRQAAAWADVCEISDRVFLRDDMGRRGFACKVVVQYVPAKQHSHYVNGECEILGVAR